MRLNRAGEMVERLWSEIPQFYAGFLLHEFVVMPNHFYAIVETAGTTPPWVSDVHVTKQVNHP